ncbi:DsbA family protein [Chloroflexota bacterium]
MAEQSSLVRLEEDFDIGVDWRGFELHPETPMGGLLLEQVFPASRIKDMREYMEKFAVGFGIHDMETPIRMPNTRRALAITEFARDHGRLDDFRKLAMKAHWKEGRNLESMNDLAEIATLSGLDAEATLRAADSSEYLGRVDKLHDEACRMGITGIPTFIIGKERVVGCQPYEVLAGATRRAGAVQSGRFPKD